MVRQSVFNKLSKGFIPFAASSTTFLMFNVKSAFAKTLLERGDVSKGMFSKKAISERGGSLEEFREVFDKLGWVLDRFIAGIKWVNHGIENMQQVSIDLLSFIYKTLATFVLTTPTFIFNNPYLKSTSLTFSIISITLVSILTIYESIMQVTKQKHTKFKDIIKRYFTVVGVAGFAPFLFEKGFTILNKLTSSITKLGANLTTSKEIFSHSLSGLDVSILFAFDIVLLAMLIPILLQNGRRFWDLMCLATVSPLAGVAWVFDRHRHYFYTWWSSVKRLSLIQLVYAVFILLLGIFIFGTRMIDTYSGGVVFKLLITAGALWRMINPPRIVLAFTQGDGRDVFDVYDDYKKGYKDVFNMVTLKNFRPTNFVKNQITKSQNQKQQIAQLRQKHKMRSVSHLLNKK